MEEQFSAKHVELQELLAASGVVSKDDFSRFVVSSQEPQPVRQGNSCQHGGTISYRALVSTLCQSLASIFIAS